LKKREAKLKRRRRRTTSNEYHGLTIIKLSELLILVKFTWNLIPIKQITMFSKINKKLYTLINDNKYNNYNKD
jgi:hypothetical protein